jgi:hypothetical protein
MAIACLAALTGCVTTSLSGPVFTAQKGDDLVAAGFMVKTASTPAQIAMLARMPQRRIVSRINSDGTFRYVLADSTLCGCIYLGDQNAYEHFRSNQIDQNLASAAQLAAIGYADALWDWGAWGSWGQQYSFAYGTGWQ